MTLKEAIENGKIFSRSELIDEGVWLQVDEENGVFLVEPYNSNSIYDIKVEDVLADDWVIG